MRSTWSPLARRAPGRHAADVVWLLLLTTTFVLVSAAAASAPLVVESAQNASVVRVLDAFSDAAVVRQQPVVRVTGGVEAPLAGSDVDAVLGDVPGLGPRRVLGVSFGDELLSTGEQWRSVVEPAAGGVEPLDRRLAAVDDPAAALVPLGSAGDAGVIAGGVWLDEAAAQATGVAPGDEVRVSISGRELGGSVVLPVAGVYALSEDGTRPADVEGSTFWQDLVGRLPQSTGFGGVTPPLLTDVPTLELVAEPLEERVLWSVEAGLDPVVPTLRELTRTVRSLQDVPRALPPLPTVEGPQGRFIVASGVPGLHELSAAIATTAVDRTRGVAWSSLALTGLAVLVITLVDDSRRRHERRLEAAIGLHPMQVGGLRMLEVVPQALLGGAVGVAVAWGVVTVWGPEGVTTDRGLLAAVTDAVTVLVVALLLVGAVSATSAWATGRLTIGNGLTSSPPGRGVPWRTGLVVAAGAAVVGVLTGEEAGGGLEVVAPLLVGAGCGAVVAAAATAGLRRLLLAGGPSSGAEARQSPGSDARASGVLPVGGGAAPTAGRRQLSPRRARSVLALRRLAAPGQGQDAVVVLLSAGLAMAGFVALADRSLQSSVESKSAVLAGAASVIEIPDRQALALAPDAVPRPDREATYDLQQRPVDLDLDLATDIPVPRGDTVVWFDRVAVEGDQQVPVVVLDTDTAPAALDFGAGGGALVGAERALARLTEQAALRAPGSGADPPAPVVVVGERRGLAVGDTVEVRGTYSLISVEVVAAIPLFPGQGAVSSMLLADTDTYLPALQLDDPRYVPDGTESPLTLQAEYWSARDAREAAAQVRAAGIEVDEVETAQTRRLQPAFVAAELVQDYQLAVAALLGVVGVVGLSIRADRSAVRALPAVVVLRRTRLGRAGVRAGLVLEQVGVVVLSAVAAALALVLLVPLAPALLDPAPRLLPRLDVGAWPQVLGLLVIVATAVLPLVVATVATGLRLRGAREEEVLRDDR